MLLGVAGLVLQSAEGYYRHNKPADAPYSPAGKSEVMVEGENATDSPGNFSTAEELGLLPNRTNASTPASPTPPPDSSPAPPPPDPLGHSKNERDNNNGKKKNREENRAAKIIIIVCVCALILGVAIGFCFRKQLCPPRKKTPPGLEVQDTSYGSTENDALIRRRDDRTYGRAGYEF
mmetsp:Transcript_1264/g.3545  ORF Transcript_1264/g.3545 Transcript_1264/m.3545 type:complete len:177 (+) Transcript_1264:244-774(+)